MSFGQAQEVSFQSGIVVEPSNHHFGKIPDNEKTSFSFRVFNRLKESFTITRVETSCGCAVATPTPALVTRGGSSEVKVTIDPHGRNGYFRWEIKILTDHPEVPLVFAATDATILRNAVLSEEYLYFGEFRRGASIKKEVWVAPQDQPNFEILSAQEELGGNPEQRYFDIQIKKGTYAGFYPGPRSAYLVSVQARRDIPYGRINGKIVLTTNLPQQKKLEIPLLARVAGEIGVKPDYISLGIIKENRPVTRKIYIYHRKGLDFNIKKISSSWPHLKIEEKVKVPDSYYEITVSVDRSQKMNKGEFRGNLIIETSDHEQSTIKVPLQGFVTN